MSKIQKGHSDSLKFEQPHELGRLKWRINVWRAGGGVETLVQFNRSWDNFQYKFSIHVSGSFVERVQNAERGWDGDLFVFRPEKGEQQQRISWLCVSIRRCLAKLNCSEDALS